jgi:hypothetical protein
MPKGLPSMVRKSAGSDGSRVGDRGPAQLSAHGGIGHALLQADRALSAVPANLEVRLRSRQRLRDVPQLKVVAAVYVVAEKIHPFSVHQDGGAGRLRRQRPCGRGERRGQQYGHTERKSSLHIYAPP